MTQDTTAIEPQKSLAPTEKPIDNQSLRRSRLGLWVRWLAAGGALTGFVVSSGLVAYGAPNEPPPEVNSGAQRPARVVRVAAVQPARGERERRFYGTVRAAEEASLSFTVGGRLTSRQVELGESVSRGDVVARLDPQPLANAVAANRASLDQLEAQLGLQGREKARDRELFEAGVIADARRDQTDSAYRSLRAARDATRVQLRESQRVLAESALTAPFDGVVVAVHLEPGEYASPGVPVVTVSGAGRLEVELEVPESVVQSLTRGSQVRVDLPLAGLEGVAGKVRSMGTASGRTGLFPVVVELTDAEPVRAGMTAEVVARVTAGRGLTVPVAAVLDPSGRRPVVMVVRDGRVARVEVRVGEMIDDRVVVRGELREGDSVVVGGHTFLVDGDRVEVK